MSSRKTQLKDTFDQDLQAPPRPKLSQPTQGQVAGRRLDGTLFFLRLDRIKPDQDQVRKQHKDVDDPKTQELAQSIKDNGVLQPLNVRYVTDGDYYELVAGERRYTAAKLAGLEDVPVKVLNVDDPVEITKLQLVENIHREDLSPLELGQALDTMLDQSRTTLAELATLLRKGKPWVQKAVTIHRKLSPAAKAEIDQFPEYFQSLTHLYEVAQLPADEQQSILQHMRTDGLTREQLQQITVDRKQANKNRSNRGRPAKSKPFAKTFTTENGATVTIRFRKSRASQEDVTTALQQALKDAA